MLLRQLFDSKSSTYSFLLADKDTREAVFIDTVFECHQRDAALIEELDLKLLYTLETHVHADHITGAWLMRERFGSRIGVSEHGGADGVDQLLSHGTTIQFGQHTLEVRATPGHTNGCVTFVLGDQSMAFTGDSLLIRGAGRTDFQQGSARTLYQSVHEQIFSLPDSTVLYPGHDYSGRMSTTVAEEKQLNPRLGGEIGVVDFVGHMDNLGLPHPKQIDVAIPANLTCGKPTAERPGPVVPDWAPVFRSYAGVPELSIDWVHENRSTVNLVDVRELSEFDGELGHIKGAQLIPIGSLLQELEGNDRSRALVIVCRSGSRSARAALMLEKKGFTRVAHMTGGMIRWRAAELPTTREN